MLNQVNIIGNIGEEPIVKTFQSGKKVARFSVAVNGYSKDPENRPAPTWVDCEMWDQAMERLLKCRQKAKLRGRQILVTGALALNTYMQEVGSEQQKRKRLYVKVGSFSLLGGLKGLESSDEPSPTMEAITEEFDGTDEDDQETETKSRKASETKSRKAS